MSRDTACIAWEAAAGVSDEGAKGLGHPSAVHYAPPPSAAANDGTAAVVVERRALPRPAASLGKVLWCGGADPQQPEATPSIRSKWEEAVDALHAVGKQSVGTRRSEQGCVPRVTDRTTTWRHCEDAARGLAVLVSDSNSMG